MNKKIRIENSRFVTDTGEPFIPKGVNMVCKDSSKSYIGNYSENDLSGLKESGCNLIRLGIFWDGAEPEPGIYDENYLNKLEILINMAAKADIPVFLDMHQDLFSVLYADGAPKWATLTDNKEHIRTGLWSESYLISPAVQHAFDNFWNNSPAADGIGIRTHYINMWKHIASKFADNPYVIGYDVMNEPFPGSSGAQIAAILGEFEKNGGSISGGFDEAALFGLISKIVPVTASFEQEILSPFYDELFSSIREVDKKTILIFESNYFANAGIPSHIRPAVDPSGNTVSYQAYAPHGYDILVDTDAYSSDPGNERIDLIFGSILQKISELAEQGIPSFIGEWGCYPQASPAQLKQAEHILKLLDAHAIGNVYYEYGHLSVLKDRGRFSVFSF